MKKVLSLILVSGMLLGSTSSFAVNNHKKTEDSSIKKIVTGIGCTAAGVIVGLVGYTVIKKLYARIRATTATHEYEARMHQREQQIRNPNLRFRQRVDIAQAMRNDTEQTLQELRDLNTELNDPEIARRVNNMQAEVILLEVPLLAAQGAAEVQRAAENNCSVM